jgi:hypothetical protein
MEIFRSTSWEYSESASYSGAASGKYSRAASSIMGIIRTAS